MFDIQPLTIRRMRAEDAVPLAQAFADMNKMVAQYERYWRENLDGKRVTLIAECSGQIVGYTNVIWQPQYAAFRESAIPEINDMNVVTPLRCHGIGTRMIGAAEHLVRERGYKIIGIGVGVTPDYAIAQRLYPKLGYISDGTGIHKDAWDGCLYFTKPL